ncbi:uncharacterized protein B0H64DRAFT_394944 [Chaetomium fimeti]|uniref:Uncharacterized protein n=1 Tax=Chaetomium fimeti TaxID=1854472 RepID=A0AAE0HF66_9PEZI|nr:hypothetical protein B0H64DRAFT_394944 [Chaetomium fimeti]
MAKVVCECGRSFKTDMSMNQHRRDSPRHQEHPEDAAGDSTPASSSRATRSGRPTRQASTKPRTSSFEWYASRYPVTQFVRAGESPETIKANKLGQKRKTTVEVLSISSHRRSYVQYTHRDNLDWGLCDKDCGWCGRCANGVVF